MRAPRKSSGSSSRVRFLGSERGAAHGAWYRTVAKHYGMLFDPAREPNAAEFLDDAFRRHRPVRDVLDVACGTFEIDVGLLRRGYRIVGRDLSDAMLWVARRNLRKLGLKADLGRADMRTLRMNRTFDAVLCLGTAFNYLVDPADVRRALGRFHDLVKGGGLLVLDLTNFEHFLDNPMNVRAEVDHRAPNGTRIAIFAMNEQNRANTVHVARFFTVVERGDRIDIRFDEAPLKVWRKEGIARALRQYGFRPVEWWGDLRRGARYERKRSARLVVVAVRI